MLLPVLIACSSHLAGALLGLGGRRKSLSALRTFAVVSALAVVLAQLLPDALGGAGLWALVLFAAGGLVPTLIERVSARLGRSGDWVGLELGYLGLLVHKLADGVGLGTYAGAQHEGHDHGDVLLALSAHTVPVVALVALAYQRRSGWPVAALRVLGLLAATVAGIVGTNMVPAAAFEPIEPWVTAAVAGLLLHVVVHDWEPARGPRTLRDRLVDLVAVAAGIGLVLIGGHHHHHEGEDLGGRVAAALWELSIETAPALLFGLIVGALLSAWGSGRLPSRWLRGGALRQALVGASIGAPLPICACGVLPLAQALRRRGAGPALVVAFLLATPELGVETFALTGGLLGWPFAVLRLGAAMLLAMVAALAVHRASRAPSGEVRESVAAPAPAGSGSFGHRFAVSLDELVYHVAPWTVVGLVAAAYVQATLGADSLGRLPFGLDVLVITVIAVPSYVCAASATPLAAVLLAKGLSPGAVLVGLLLGPATNLATVGFLRKAYGGRATAIGLVVLVLAAWALAFGVEVSGFEVVPSVATEEEHTHGVVALGAAIVLAIVLLRSVWKEGLRGWLASLGEALAPHGHAHGHSHGHSHSHGHGHGHGEGCSHDHHDHGHGHDHGESCSHGHHHGHDHDHGHGHDHDENCSHDHHPDHGESCSHDHDHDEGCSRERGPEGGGS